MNNCKKFEKQFTAYIDGELSDAKCVALERHLEICASCQIELDAQRSTLDLLGEALDVAPASSELKAWWHLPIKNSTPNRRWADLWYGPRCKAILVSTAVFTALFLISVNLVVFQVFQRNEVAFDEVAVNLEANQLAANRPKMKLKKAKPPAQSASTCNLRMVTKVTPAQRPEIKLPELDYEAALQAHRYETEAYDQRVGNRFMVPTENPLSTFSIDVDRAAYANVRRFLANNQLPPPDAVRIEEMVNYFDYDYPEPVGADPFVVSTDVADCPWNKTHRLALIGLQGIKINSENLPPNNLVFLIDVSSSMKGSEKLPLLKSSMRLLIGQLRPEDRVSIVVYAGATGLVLEPTNNHIKIFEALDRLKAGGSTAGGEGIHLAYNVAKKTFIKNGNNRVILATDGDFNVGATSDKDLLRMITKKRRSGIYLSVLGFGSGNLNDSRMEKLADKGNGNYAYIDDILDAKKGLIKEIGGTLMTIAKEVKIQVEFNPSMVKAYRLIGYENRMLDRKDFNADKTDAGELGAGHTVTALYELIPAGSDERVVLAGDLKYQRTRLIDSNELMTVKLRYKQPDGDVSRLITEIVAAADFKSITSGGNIGFASAVAEFGLLLRDSKFKGTSSYDDVLKRAKEFRGRDTEGYRAEFIRMVEKAQLLDQ